MIHVCLCVCADYPSEIHYKAVALFSCLIFQEKTQNEVKVPTTNLKQVTATVVVVVVALVVAAACTV